MCLCLSLGLVLRRGRVSSLSFVALTSSGYQIALTGNIIANKGFILQYGTSVNAAGAVILNADHVAAWGGVQSAGQGESSFETRSRRHRHAHAALYFGSIWAKVQFLSIMGSLGHCCGSGIIRSRLENLVGSQDHVRFRSRIGSIPHKSLYDRVVPWAYSRFPPDLLFCLVSTFQTSLISGTRLASYSPLSHLNSTTIETRSTTSCQSILNGR